MAALTRARAAAVSARGTPASVRAPNPLADVAARTGESR